MYCIFVTFIQQEQPTAVKLNKPRRPGSHIKLSEKRKAREIPRHACPVLRRERLAYTAATWAVVLGEGASGCCRVTLTDLGAIL